MSGPIVRKYGFPNFEQIFGKKEPQHGIDDAAPAAEPPGGTTEPDKKPNEGETKKPQAS